MSGLRKNILPILGIATVIVAIWGGLLKFSLSFAQQANDDNLHTLLLVMELDLLAESLGDSKLPLISGVFQGAAKDLSKAQSFLEFSTALSTIMYVVLAAFDILAVRLIWIVLGILTLWSQFRKWAGRWLILLLLLFPGLPLYTAGFHLLNHQVQAELQWQPHTTISDAHDHYKVQETSDVSSSAKLKKNTDREETTLVSSKDYHHRHQVIKETTQKITQAGIRILTESILIHLLVPFLYLMILRKVVKYEIKDIG